MIKVGTYRDISEEFDEIWFIMRSAKQIPGSSKVLVKHVPELSPSYPLFRMYLDLKNKGEWNDEAFKTKYTPVFLQEMLEPRAVHKLREVYGLAKEKNILLACACKDESLCHRKIIAGLLQGKAETLGDKGFKLSSESPSNYSHYYNDYVNYSPLK